MEEQQFFQIYIVIYQTSSDILSNKALISHNPVQQPTNTCTLPSSQGRCERSSTSEPWARAQNAPASALRLKHKLPLLMFLKEWKGGTAIDVQSSQQRCHLRKKRGLGLYAICHDLPRILEWE